jgi:hypothetical protein
VRRWILTLISSVGVACGCDKAPIDPPLPAPKFEVAPAPPGALGAKAAGTDAAPAPPDDEHQNPWPEEEQAAPPHPPLKPNDGGPTPQSDAGGLPL